MFDLSDELSLTCFLFTFGTDSLQIRLTDGLGQMFFTVGFYFSAAAFIVFTTDYLSQKSTVVTLEV